MPSLLTKIENATVLPALKIFFNLPPVDHQPFEPELPADDTVRRRPNIPGLKLLLGNSPPTFLPLLLGETVQQTSYQGMPVVQITPAHPDGDYVVAIHGGAGFLPPLIFHWIDYSMMAFQTRAHHRSADHHLLDAAGSHRQGHHPENSRADRIRDHRARGFPRQRARRLGGRHREALVGRIPRRPHNETVPGAMVLLSPVVDLTFSNPAIGSINSWLPPTSTLKQIGQSWAGGLPVTDYEVSPLYGSLQGLHLPRSTQARRTSPPPTWPSCSRTRSPRVPRSASCWPPGKPRRLDSGHHGRAALLAADRPGTRCLKTRCRKETLSSRRELSSMTAQTLKSVGA